MYIEMSNESNARYKQKYSWERDSKHKHNDMFQGSSAKIYVPAFTA